MRKAKFSEVLEECIEAVLEGRRSVDDCLSLYPQLAAELQPLLTTALEVNETFQTEAPSWHVQERVRLRVLAAHQARIRSRNLVSGVDLTRSGHWGVRHWGVLASAAAAVVGAVFVASLMLFGGGGDTQGPQQQGTVVFDLQQSVDDARTAYQEGRIDYESLKAIALKTSDILAQYSTPESIEAADPDTKAAIQDALVSAGELLDTLPADEPVDPEEGATVRDLNDDVKDAAELFGVPPPTPTPPVATETPAPSDAASPTPVPTAEPTPSPTPAPTQTLAPTATPVPSSAASGDGSSEAPEVSE